MSEYKSIKGKTIQYLGTDPSDTGAEGQLWYNSAAGAFKSVLVNEAWSAGANLVTGRVHIGSSGTQTAGLAWCGDPGSSPNLSNSTEEYNGSGWATGGDFTVSTRRVFGAGTQTASVAAGGDVAPNTASYEYDGSSWTAGNSINTGRTQHNMAGTQTAGLMFGGRPPDYLASTEEYDGTNWTTGGSLNTARARLSGNGIQTATVAMGGNPTPGAGTATEEYDGTSWTTSNSMNNVRRQAASAGIQTSTIIFGGDADPGFLTKTENYDGSTWTESPANLSTTVNGHGGAGTSSASVSFGGYTGTVYTSATEEYNKSANVITGAAWASGGNMNTARYLLASAGTVESAMLGAGGYGPPAPANNTFANVEEYNGTSWTEVNDIPAIKSRFKGAGTQTAAVTFGGFTPLGPNTNYNTTEKYDGTNWTTSGTMNTARCYMAGFGTQTAAVCAGGATLNPDVGFNKTEEYNGTSWSEVNNMPNYFRNQSGAGIITAAVVSGGFEGPSSSYPSLTSTLTTLEYDGTNWTSGGVNLSPAPGLSSGGTQSSAWFAGYFPGTTNTHYNGTSFVTSASTAGSHSSAGGGAPQTAGIIFGGYDTGLVSATEEFTGETSALNLKTLTTS